MELIQNRSEIPLNELNLYVSEVKKVLQEKISDMQKIRMDEDWYGIKFSLICVWDCKLKHTFGAFHKMDFE